MTTNMTGAPGLYVYIPGNPFPKPPRPDQIPPGMSFGLKAFFPADKAGLPYNGHMILGVTSFITALSLIIVSTRLYVRHFRLKAFGWDDATILGGMLLSLSVMACFIANVMNGAGRHFYHIQVPEEYERLKHVQYAQIPLNTFGVMLVKLSIGFGMLRILVHKVYRWIAISLMASVVVVTAITFIPFLVECQPMHMSWAYLKPAEKCMSFALFKSFADANGIFSTITDFLFVLLPIPTIWSLQVNMRTKLSLLAVLSVGVLAGGCSIARILVGLLPFHISDSPWTLTFFIWYHAELNAGLIAASLPPLRPLLSRWLGEKTRRFRTGAGSGYGGYGNKSGSSASRSQGWQRQHDVPLSKTDNWQKTSRSETSKGGPIGHTTYASKGSFGDSSREEILQPGKNEGIVRSVEINVKEDRIV